LTEQSSQQAQAIAEGITSPLALLLEEERRDDRQAEEALLLSFTADLGFFESIGLGVAQASGARVTIVSDAAMTVSDPRAVRRAGRSYVAGLARCTGAFHPKLVVLAGPERATVAIGSGNTTLAGWQANAELWTVFRGDGNAVPAFLPDLTSWLRTLPEQTRFSAGVGEALQRVAGGLESLAEGADRRQPEVRLVSSLTGPIIEQLPTGPVDELAVCAPFHDPGAVALQALVKRLRPRRLLVSYQPELTELDGSAVAQLVDDVGGEVRIDPERRYRHGKLIEWEVGGHRHALTGSPNLSGQGLLRSQARGGNCELGVIAPIGASLLPEGSTTPTATVRSVRLPPHRPVDPGPLLLGAIRNPEGLHIQLAVPLKRPGYLELSPASAPPETWERIADLPPGSTDLQVTIGAEGGSRLRLVVVDDQGMARHGNLVFVVDPARAARRPGITAKAAPTVTPQDLFSDPRLAQRFFADVAALRAGLPSGISRASAATGTAERTTLTIRLDTDPDDWERYLDACAGHLGHPLLRFALGLPEPPSQGDSPYDAVIPVSWDEQVNDDFEAGLEDDDAETVAAETDEDTPIVARPPDLSRTTIDVRRRYQRWAAHLADAAPQLGPPERMLVVRLLLWTVAAQAWPPDDRSWMHLLADALRALDRGDLPTDVEPPIGSLAAIGLSVLRAYAPRYEHTQETTAYTQAAEGVAHLLPAADTAYLQEYAKLLDDAFGTAVNPETVRTLAEEVVQADPIAGAVWALAERGRETHRHGRRFLHVMGRFSNPLLVALEAVGAAQDAEIVGAWAGSPPGKWALLIWPRPDIVAVESGNEAILWRHYRLTGLVTPRLLAREMSISSALPISHGPLDQPFAEALQLLGQLGLTDPRPPRQCDHHDGMP
jgi:hypothetical protein